MVKRFQTNPSELHLNAVKRIMKYVSSMCEFGLWYSFDSNNYLVGYNDADWAGSLDDRKSTSGGCFYLGNNLVRWKKALEDPMRKAREESLRKGYLTLKKAKLLSQMPTKIPTPLASDSDSEEGSQADESNHSTTPSSSLVSSDHQNSER
ncbi:secreted RxLR effector protein 161-like [Pistacia vera]|uniref:secreted RxLR effector protein 161-like n=1 Tax=Pistacia vera TaxID=55513 RepID=UPI0012633BEC|nr:secreted RxLR effector protein 161-like [Pistacia vera]